MVRDGVAICFPPPRSPTRRMLHDVIILIHVFNFEIPEITKDLFFHIFFPTEGNFDIDARDEDGGRQIITQNHKKYKNIFRTKIVHTSGYFSNNVQNLFKRIFIYTENDTEADKRIVINNL